MPRNGSGSYNLPQPPFQPNTTIQSAVMNSNLNDIATAIGNSLAKDGQTTPTANLPMGSFKHTGVANATARNHYAAVGQVQDNGFNWCGTAGGTPDGITLAPAVGITAYAAGQTFWFVPASANTGAVTVAISGLAAKSITKAGATALIAGDLSTIRIYQITYDGTQFQLNSDPLGTYAPINSPVFTGNPQAPTPALGDVSTSIATTAFVAASTLPTGAIVDFPSVSAQSGFVYCDGSTIGNVGSGATQRANADTFPLYEYNWNNISNANLIIQDSSGSPTIRGASAASDFAALKRMPTFDLRDRFRRGFGIVADPTRTLGSSEADAFQGHWHDAVQGGLSGAAGSGVTVLQAGAGFKGTSMVSSPVTDTANGTPRTAKETRPANIAFGAYQKL